MARAKILAVDDNSEALFALQEMLRAEDYDVVTASNGKEAVEKADSESPDLILLDVVMPEMNGYEATKAIKDDPVLRYIPVVLLTSLGTLQEVVEGLEHGADDYIKKPYQKDELLSRINAAMRTRSIYRELDLTRRENVELHQRIGEKFSFANIIGKSAAIREVFSLIEKIHDADVPVLITGESGTGKELVAAAIHCNSRRKGKIFVVQNCSAFNDNLLESELFGHVKGAFTGALRDKQGLFEVADGGTFFLDEVGEMSLPLQAKLLRVLQDGTFLPVGATKMRKANVRIVAATNKDLFDMTKKGTFREDLYYRLNVVNIKLPPLRERKEDIPMLAEHFLNEHAKKYQKQKKTLASETLLALANYDWPGNIRELQNEVERLILMSGAETAVTPEYVSPVVRGKQAPGAPKPSIGTLKEATEELEKTMIRAALERLKWNKSEAARELGVSRSSLISKVQAYGLEEPSK